MTLPLTVDNLRTAYDYLNSTQPFLKWNLPDSEDVKFTVGRDANLWGWYQRKSGVHTIGMSRRFIGTTDNLMRTMAHEMIHLHEAHAGACGSGQHSAAFRRWAAEVCRHHGFDPLIF